MTTKAYVVTDKGGSRPDIAGKVRVVGSTIYLTDFESLFELSRGVISATDPQGVPTSPVVSNSGVGAVIADSGEVSSALYQLVAGAYVIVGYLPAIGTLIPAGVSDPITGTELIHNL